MSTAKLKRIKNTEWVGNNYGTSAAEYASQDGRYFLCGHKRNGYRTEWRVFDMTMPKAVYGDVVLGMPHPILKEVTFKVARETVLRLVAQGK